MAIRSLRARFRMISCTCTFVPTSMPWVGSSSSSTRGFVASQRARATFWRLPPDSELTRDSMSPLMLSASRCSLARARSLRGAMKPARESLRMLGSATFAVMLIEAMTPSASRSSGR